MTEVLNLNVNGSITCHAWNKDRTQIALSANSKDVVIFQKSGTNWQAAQTLSEHSSKVLSIDWAPESNRIVTCGADKNAYVWSFDGRVWKPELVVLRINRAATCVKWSPNEKKFAVGCGHRCICVCYYETEQCFWVAKHIKKQIKSTTLCLDWHPNNVLIAAGGSDFKCRIFCAYVSEVDGPAPTSNVWTGAAPLKPAECLLEFAALNHGWVHACAFSPSGNALAFTGHDSTVYVVDATQNPQVVISLRTAFLPFLSLQFISDQAFVAAGHDCYPVVFAFSGNTIRLAEKLEVSAAKQTSGTTSAMDLFNRLDRSRQDQASTSSTNTIHQNSIKDICVYKKNGAKVSHFSTVGLDGIAVLWDLNTLEGQFNNLRIR